MDIFFLKEWEGMGIHTLPNRKGMYHHSNTSAMHCEMGIFLGPLCAPINLGKDFMDVNRKYS